MDVGLPETMVSPLDRYASSTGHIDCRQESKSKSKLSNLALAQPIHSLLMILGWPLQDLGGLGLDHFALHPCP